MSDLPRLTNEEVADALDGGSTDSGIYDQVLKQRCYEQLQDMTSRDRGR